MKKTILIFLFIICAPLMAVTKKQLDHSVYDFWNRTIQHAISDNGKWLLYAVKPDNGDGKITFRNLENNSEFVIARGDSAAFSKDASFAMFLIRAKLDSVKKAKKEDLKGKEAPQDSLALIDLKTGAVKILGVAKNYKMPEEHDGFMAWRYKFTNLPEDSAKTDSLKKHVSKKEEKDEKSKAFGDTLVVFDWKTKKRHYFEHVTDYAFSKDGSSLAIALASKDSLHDGVLVFDQKRDTVESLIQRPGEYKFLTWDENGKQLAFISNSDSFQTKQQSYSLYYWNKSTDGIRKIVSEDSPGVADGWWISEHAKPEFSKNGKRLFFATAPRPASETVDESLEEKPKLDVWHWKDPLIQPMQLKQLDVKKKRNYKAVYQIKDKKVVQLGTIDIPEIIFNVEANGEYALGRSNLPHRKEISWDFPKYYDFFIIDIRTGTRKRVKEKVQYPAKISPGGKYIFWWDRNEKTWKIMSTESKVEYNSGKEIPFALYDERHDQPYKPSAYGFAGWTENDESFVFYDRYDLWAFNPKKDKKAVNLTKGYGRERDLRLRFVQPDKEEKIIKTAQPLLLSAFHDSTKYAGFFRLDIRKPGEIQKIILEPEHFSKPVKAKNAAVVYFTRENFEKFPNFWVSNPDLSNLRKVSDINPQQKDYLWGTAEQIQWYSLDGHLLQGIFCKPENFDAAKKYPMMVYFYEKNSDNLYRHQMPEAHRSVINWTFYTSRGYVVFIPDIPYKTGFPGQSAFNAVIPGVTKLIERGYVDKENIGVQGHSWGGYQIAYLVTQTNIFKAAEAGAPVANMTSAYGGIRWGTGKSRMFQYENTQSRIGGTLWEKPLHYIENSPLFQLDNVETPLLIMHNDQDGHVPWEQGIELFNALRRLEKPAWMIVYNDQPHWPITFFNKRDWQIRLQQYFDHFLTGAPAPVWIEEGIPAIKKGKTLGTEFAE